jgi:PST family polysaccharide transporter
VALLFALPIIVGLYIFSPFVLEIFFSKAFLAGSDLTKWLAISCFFKAICWPLGYIIIAKGKKMMFVITSLFWEIVHIPLIYFFMNQYGIEGIGLSFVLDYFLVAIGSTLVSQYFFNFKWAKETLYSIISSFSLIVVLVTINFLKLNSLILFIGGCLILILSIVRMIFIFQKRMNLNFLQILKGKLH